VLKVFGEHRLSPGNKEPQAGRRVLADSPYPRKIRREGEWQRNSSHVLQLSQNCNAGRGK